MEQFSKPGGYATTFKRKHYTMEVGLHSICGCYDGDPKQKMYNDLCIPDNIPFAAIPEFYRFVHGKTEIVISFSVEENIRNLSNMFPGDAKGIETFFMVVDSITADLSSFIDKGWAALKKHPFLALTKKSLLKYRNTTVGDFLDGIIKNEDLKIALVASVIYYHDDPYTMSLLHFAMAVGGYYKGGGCFIAGGSSRLSDYLAGCVTSHNGKILYNNTAKRLISDGNKIKGVIYNSKTDESVHSVYADTVVYNGAIPNMTAMIDDSKVQNKLENALSGAEIACSALSIYIGFKTNLRNLGNKHYATFFLDQSVTRLRDFGANLKDVYAKRFFTFVDYGQIESKLSPSNTSVGFLCTPDYYADWQGTCPIEYSRKKKGATDSLLQRLDLFMPNATKEIDVAVTATSKTLQRYTLNPQGSFNGFSQTVGQSGLNRSKMIPNIYKGLYFASAWSFPGGGFMPTMVNGYQTARDILKRS